MFLFRNELASTTKLIVLFPEFFYLEVSEQKFRSNYENSWLVIDFPDRTVLNFRIFYFYLLFRISLFRNLTLAKRSNLAAELEFIHNLFTVHHDCCSSRRWDGVGWAGIFLECVFLTFYLRIFAGIVWYGLQKQWSW